MTTELDTLIKASAVCMQLGGISATTLWRWERDGILPHSRIVRGRKYWLQSEIQAVTESIGRGDYSQPAS